MARTLRITIAIVLGFLAHGWQPGDASGQPVPPRTLIDQDLWRQPSVASLSKQSGVEVVLAGAGQPDAFRVDYALIEQKPGEDLGVVLGRVRHQALFPTANGQPQIKGSVAPRLTRRAPFRMLPPKTTFVPVRLQQGLVSSVEAAILVRHKFGARVRFSSDQALRAMGEIVKYGLVPDFVMKPAQLVTSGNVREDKTVTDAWPGADGYWQMQDLFRAWQLSQVADPKPAFDVWVAVVDQGFMLPKPGDPPLGITWDAARYLDAGIGDAGDDPNRPWHGTNCGAVLNAGVNDEIGAAGSALFGSASAVKPLVPRNVRTMAVEIAHGFNGTYYSIGRAIKDAVAQRANIVSVSYSGDCNGACSAGYSSSPDKEIVDALQVASAASSLVLFSAGNDGIDMDATNRQIVGCETPGALCVGGFDRDEYRWRSNQLGANKIYLGSNYGAAVKLWGPAHWVWANGDQQFPFTHRLDGTSFATPYMAGILALVESASGQVLSLATVLNKLTSPGILRPGKSNPGDPATKIPQVLNAYALARLFAVNPARDAFESQPAAFPGPLDLLTLDTPSDTDSYPIVTTGCEALTFTVSYLRDEALGHFSAIVRTTGVSPKVVVAAPVDDALVATVLACPGTHHLEISADKKLTTGYSVSLARQPFVCDPRCGPADPGALDPWPPPKADPTQIDVLQKGSAGKGISE